MIKAGVRVQTCITSPPYWGLRSYLNDGHADKQFELGSEPTPEAYVQNMVEVFSLVREVLADDGTLWLNLGSSYAGGGGYAPGAPSNSPEAARARGYHGGIKEHERKPRDRALGGFKPKDLIPTPWMVAMALQADGWYLRSDIIWHKPNPLPESCRDRPTKSHEYLFLLSKRPQYFYDCDAVREEGSRNTHARFAKGGVPQLSGQKWNISNGGSKPNAWAVEQVQGRNKRTVWTITPKPFKGAHFAIFPPALVEPCILAGSSERGHCPGCGKRWARVLEHLLGDNEAANRPKRTAGMASKTSTLSLSGNGSREWALRGGKTLSHSWQSGCTCGLDPVPDVVLDPFGGAGTTGLVAQQLGRQWIQIELNRDYAEMSEKRIQQLAPENSEARLLKKVA